MVLKLGLFPPSYDLSDGVLRSVSLFEAASWVLSGGMVVGVRVILLLLVV